MKYWFCITTEENWKVIKEENVFGVPERHRNTVEKVNPGDRLVIYLKQERTKDRIVEPRVVAVYEAVSKAFRDSTRIFKAPKGMGNESFPLRIKLKPVKIFEKPVEFKPLIPKLKFVTNKKKWSGHLMGKAMREIPEEDYKLLISFA